MFQCTKKYLKHMQQKQSQELSFYLMGGDPFSDVKQNNFHRAVSLLLKVYLLSLTLSSFIAIADNNWLLQTAKIQMRRLIMSRLIWIYTVWHSVFQLYI